MPIIRWKPFEELDKFFEDIPFHFTTWDLAVDVYEDDGNIKVEMHIPGIEPDKIDIEVEDNLLRVFGSREKIEKVENKHYYHKEIKRGSFERIIELPCSIVSEAAKAEFSDGVLRILLPKEKVKEKAPSKIKIERK